MNNMNTTPKTFPTLFDLFQQWCNDGYPDYVTGVWSTDGGYYNLTIGVTNDEAGETGKQEILNLIENDASVTFVTQTYSRNYLLQIQEELLPYFKQEECGMVANGLYDTENCIYVEIHTDKAGSESSLDFIAELKSKYGDAVSFHYTDGIPVDTLEEIGLTTTLTPSVPEKPFVSPLLITGLVLIPLLIFGTYFSLRKHFVPVMQANTGGTVTRSGRISVKEVEEMVKDSSLTVSREVDKSVMEGIEKLVK